MDLKLRARCACRVSRDAGAVLVRFREKFVEFLHQSSHREDENETSRLSQKGLFDG